MVSIPDAVREFFRGQRIESAGVVAVSGGPDSVALLRALVAAGYGPLTVGHVNHQLRGAESDADEEFVRELAVTLGANFRSARIVVPPNENLESAARRRRYEFLHSVAVDVKASWIATGHTADDQAETVLHRLIRGAGLQGLRGIAATKFSGDAEALRSGARAPLNVLRPLLHVTRPDVLEYLATLDQPARTDSSNTDRRFTRNRIRHELLPLLKAFNPEMVAVLNRVAEHASEAFDFIESHAAKLLQQAERPRAGETLILDKATLEQSPPFLVRELFRLLWRREGWPLDAMTAAHWLRVGALQPADYPGGVKVRVIGRVVQLHRNK